MAEWEYCYVYQHFDPSGEEISVVTVDAVGVHSPHTESNLDVALQRLRVQGWEQIATAPVFAGFDGKMTRLFDYYRFRRANAS